MRAVDVAVFFVARCAAAAASLAFAVVLLLACGMYACGHAAGIKVLAPLGTQKQF